MTPEQLRDHLYDKWDVRARPERRAYRDNGVDSTHNSYGNCSHEIALALHCPECAKEDESVLARAAVYQRHTVDITGAAPQYIEDELLAVERGLRRAKWAWLFLGVLVAAYVVVRVWAGGER